MKRNRKTRKIPRDSKTNDIGPIWGKLQNFAKSSKMSFD